MREPFRGTGEACTDLTGALVHAEMRDICSWTKNIRTLKPVLPEVAPFIPGVSVKCPCPNVNTHGKPWFRISEDCCSWDLHLDIPDCFASSTLRLVSGGGEPGALTFDKIGKACPENFDYVLGFTPIACPSGFGIQQKPCYDSNGVLKPCKPGLKIKHSTVEQEGEEEPVEDPCSWEIGLSDVPNGGGGGGCGILKVNATSNLPAGWSFIVDPGPGNNTSCTKSFGLKLNYNPDEAGGGGGGKLECIPEAKAECSARFAPLVGGGDGATYCKVSVRMQCFHEGKQVGDSGESSKIIRLEPPWAGISASDGTPKCVQRLTINLSATGELTKVTSGAIQYKFNKHGLLVDHRESTTSNLVTVSGKLPTTTCDEVVEGRQ